MEGEPIHQIYRSTVATWAHHASRWIDLGGRRPYQACPREQYDMCIHIVIPMCMDAVRTQSEQSEPSEAQRSAAKRSEAQRSAAKRSEAQRSAAKRGELVWTAFHIIHAQTYTSDMKTSTHQT